MALARVGITDSALRYTFSPGWNQIASFNHNHPAGADGFLFLAMSMSNSTSFDTNNVFYGGQQMTKLFEITFGALSQKQAIYGLLNPPSGSNAFSITLAGQQFNPIHCLVQSFHGCAGFGNFDGNSDSVSPNSKTLTVSAGSMIYVTSVSTQSIDHFEVASTNIGELFEVNINKQVAGQFSGALATAGSKSVVAYSISSAYTLSNFRIEIKESATPPQPTQNSSFLQFF